MKQVTIGVNEDGQRVDRIVAKLLSGAGKGLVYKAIRKKIVTLNGKKTEPDVRVKEGDELKLFFSDETLRELGGTVSASVSDDRSMVSLSNDRSKPNCDKRMPETAKPDASKPCSSGLSLGQNRSSTGIGIRGYVFKDNILYEDKDVILVFKPAGILTQGAEAKTRKTGRFDDRGEKGGWNRNDTERKGGESEVSLNDLLIEYLEETGKLSGTGETFRPSVCNRLDRNTSGIVVCGCSLKGLRAMSFLIHDRKLRKYYLCAVKGIIDRPGDLKGWLVKNEKTNKVKVFDDKPADPGALNIETKFKPLATAHDMTLLEVELVTGRPHQIRAHMASTGHPVVGDPKYGDAAFNRMIAKKFDIKYQMLSARRLVFPRDCGGCGDLSEKEFKGKIPGELLKIFGDRFVV